MIYLASLFAPLLVAVTQPKVEGSHDVALSIHVQDDSGSPINDVPLLASFGGQPAPDRGRCRTDQKGNGTMSVWAADTPGEVVVVCADIYGIMDPTGEPAKRYYSLTSTHDFKKWYRVPLLGSEATASLTIVAPRAMAVEGTLKMPAGSVGLVAARLEGESSAIGEEDGKFQLGGFVPGKTGTILIALENQDRVIAHQVTVAPDADLHVVKKIEVTWPPAEEKIKPVVITMKFDRSLPTLYGALSMEACLVSMDGSIMYDFPLNRGTGKMQSGRSGTMDTEVAPGEYYIVPGDVFGGTGALLYRYVKAGRFAELDAARIPKLVVKPDAAAPVTIDIDSAAVWKQLQTLEEFQQPKR